MEIMGLRKWGMVGNQFPLGDEIPLGEGLEKALVKCAELMDKMAEYGGEVDNLGVGEGWDLCSREVKKKFTRRM